MRRSCHITITRVTTVAKASDVGNEAHTPSRPIVLGSVINSGIRNITCLMRLRNIDLPAMPIDWNSVVDTI